MVCANPHAQFIREFDTFRNKVGLESIPEVFSADVESELERNAHMLGLELGSNQLPEQTRRFRLR